MIWWKRLALTFSLTAAMTGFAVALFLVATWLFESVPPAWRFQDDWLWLMLPLGAAVGLALWLRFRRRAWIHLSGPLLILWLVASIAHVLSLEAPRGMAGIGITIGKAIAAATAYIAAVTGLITFAIAFAVVLAVTWRQSATPPPTEQE